MIEEVVLNFDPYYTDDVHIDIFNDPVARTLYLGIKQQHIVSTRFNQNCLDISRQVTIRPPDGRVLFAWLVDAGMIGSSEREFSDELLPYVLGQKVITWRQASANEMQTGHPG